jgi:hypothetical protein
MIVVVIIDVIKNHLKERKKNFHHEKFNQMAMKVSSEPPKSPLMFGVLFFSAIIYVRLEFCLMSEPFMSFLLPLFMVSLEEKTLALIHV